MTKKVEIPLSKTKLIWLAIGSILFVILGCWFVVDPANFTSYRYRSETIAVIIGTASILFFVICAFSIFRKLLDHTAGLIIDDKGIYDNSSAVSSGQILWEEIDSIGEYEIQNQKFIVLIVKNPQHFIMAKSRKYQRNIAEMNFKLTGSPININVNSLEISHLALLKIITDHYDLNKNK